MALDYYKNNIFPTKMTLTTQELLATKKLFLHSQRLQRLEKTLEIDYDVFVSNYYHRIEEKRKGKKNEKFEYFFVCVLLEPSQKWNKKICFLSIHIYAYPILCQWLAIFSYHNATQHCITNCRPNFVICKKILIAIHL